MKISRAWISAILIAGIFGLSGSAWGQKTRHSVNYLPQWTWDLGVGGGTYGNYSFTEIEVGVNDQFVDSFSWRNVLWNRFGSAPVASALGVDTSLRYDFRESDRGRSGFHFYLGPGLRLSNGQYTGVFAETGIIVHVGGLNVGVGVKATKYPWPGTDPATGLLMPNSDLTYFIMLSGGGAL